MKKTILNLILILGLGVSLTSCFSHKYSVGNGSQTGKTVTEKNHYFIYGLAAGTTSDPAEMADGAADFDVKTEHTFIDGLLNAITWGIYTPTTTTVTK